MDNQISLESIINVLTEIKQDINRLNDKMDSLQRTDNTSFYPIKFETREEYKSGTEDLFDAGYDSRTIGFNYSYIDKEQEIFLSNKGYRFTHVDEEEIRQVFSKAKKQYREEYINQIRKEWKETIQHLKKLKEEKVD